MKKMAFLPELAFYLKEYKTIYTVRGYCMSEANVEVEGVGRCLRVPLGVIEHKDDLLPYVSQSGFSSIEGWWAKILSFVSPRAPKYLYKVEVMNE